MAESMYGIWQMRGRGGGKVCGRPGVERMSEGQAFACQHHWWAWCVSNGLGWKSLVESVIGMWQMGGKGYLRWWKVRTLGSHNGEGFGPPTANTMHWY